VRPAPRGLGITCGGHALAARVRAAREAGVAVLVREDALPRDLFEKDGAGGSTPRNAPGRNTGATAPLILHARMPGAPEMAGERGLGLHLPGSADPHRDDVRAARATHAGLLGASTHTPDEALTALAAGADYVLLSPIWPSPGKPGDTRPPLGCAGFAALRGRPVLALGGLTPARAREALAAGAWGWAAMGALFGDPERLTPAAWAAALRDWP
jgi:thiamine monophosphate synthase